MGRRMAKDDFAFSPGYKPTRKVKLRLSTVGTKKKSEPETWDQARYINDKQQDHNEPPQKVRVPLNKLRATQDEVEIPTVKKYASNPPKDLPQGLRDPKSGKVHIVDGHHRAEAARLRGDKDIEMNIWDEPGLDKK